VLSFLYLWIIQMGRALGDSGSLPAFAAAWLPNLAFGGLAAWLYSKAEI
jgi:lipopolysaccharide export LptBFGC system permease protein LptF